MSLTYTYDARHLPVQVDEVDAQGQSATTTFGYDARGQLISEVRTGSAPYTRDYAYDNAGNRTATYDSTSGDWTIFHYDVHAVSDGFPANDYGSANHRLMWSERSTAAGTDLTFYAYANPYGHVSDVLRMGASFGDTVHLTRLVYANNGSLWLVVDEEWSQVAGPSSSQRTAVTELRQDGLTERYLVRSRDPDTLQETSSVFSDHRLVGIESDYTVSGGTAQPAVAYLRSLMHVDVSTASAYSWHMDASGNVRLTADDAGAVAGEVVYSGFGERISGSALGTRYGFQGTYDAETGLAGSGLASGWVRTGARYYDPEIGRYLMRDPLGVRGGLNVYAYCSNQVTACSDPWGLQQTPTQQGGQPRDPQWQGPPPPPSTTGAGGGSGELREIREELKELREAVNELTKTIESDPDKLRTQKSPPKPEIRMSPRSRVRILKTDYGGQRAMAQAGRLPPASDRRSMTPTLSPTN